MIPKPNQNSDSVGPECIKPGMMNASEFSIGSIAAMLTVSPTTVIFAAVRIGIVLSMGIIVNR
jgi:hypothetical protein